MTDRFAFFFKPFLIAVLLFLALRLFFFTTGTVMEMSMEPGLQSGDILLVARSAYGFRLPFGGGYLVRFRNPDRGDIVVFNRRDRKGKFIKRVVAVAGDRVQYRHPILLINGRRHAVIKNAPVQPFGGKPLIIPKGHVFVLGDNVAMSEDSMDFGPVPITSIIGRALFRIFPFRRGSTNGR